MNGTRLPELAPVTPPAVERVHEAAAPAARPLSPALRAAMVTSAGYRDLARTIQRGRASLTDGRVPEKEPRR